MKQFKATVYVGRFQPVHIAHLETMYSSLILSDLLIIAIGSSRRAPHVKNPWSADERESMIKDALVQWLKIKGISNGEAWEIVKTRVKFVHIRDYRYNNVHWASEVYSRALMAGATSDNLTRLTGCEKDDSSFYLKMFPQWTKELVPEVKGVNATDIRNVLYESGGVFGKGVNLMQCTSNSVVAWAATDIGKALRAEYEFLEDYKRSWSKAPFKPVFVTTDGVIVKSGHIALIKRGRMPGAGLWALPGGFLDQGENLEDCVIREIKEETNIKFTGTDEVAAILRRNIKRKKEFDHPNRSERGRTITHAYLIDLGEGPLPALRAGDDASEAHWVPLADLGSIENQFYEDHLDIITYFTRSL